MDNMKKIAIIGSSGSGKSTFSLQLSEKLNLPVIHLDKHFWKPGWEKTENTQWREFQKNICLGDSWIIEGNYKNTLDIRLNACDTIIFLDVNRFTCLYRVMKRSFFSKNRPDMAEGCPERFNVELIKFVWEYPQMTRLLILNKLNELTNRKRIIIASSGASVLKHFPK
tara:strand:- start:9195 stop:9698 length:504 start_codon:yes stop_codon:yes gene_type:complete